MGKLEIKNGKFEKDGVVIPPIMGDPEQVKCFEEADPINNKKEAVPEFVPNQLNLI